MESSGNKKSVEYRQQMPYLDLKGNYVKMKDLMDGSGNSIIDYIYPVGHIIYNSSSDFDPNVLYAGTTWEQIKDVFLLGAGDTYTAGDTGGEATHTLTVSEMPAHSHTYYSPVVQQVSATSSGTTYGNYNKQYKINTDSTGGGSAHNNMPPYLVVYIWKRTA